MSFAEEKDEASSTFCGAPDMTCARFTPKFRKDGLLRNQLVPPSRVLKRPPPVATYTMFGFVGSIAGERAPWLGTETLVQLAPAFSDLKTLPPIVIHRRFESEGAILKLAGLPTSG